MVCWVLIWIMAIAAAAAVDLPPQRNNTPEAQQTQLLWRTGDCLFASLQGGLVQLVEFCSSSWIGMFLAVLMHGKGGGGGGAKDFP